MKELSRKKMIDFLEKKGCRVVGNTEEFNGAKGGIWLSGEEGDGFFDYYTSNPNYTFGVLDSLERSVNDRGWWFEWNDAGTIMCWKY